MAANRNLKRSDGDTKNTCDSVCGKSSPVKILMKVDLSERAMFFRDGGQKAQKQSIFAVKCGIKHNEGLGWSILRENTI